MSEPRWQSGEQTGGAVEVAEDLYPLDRAADELERRTRELQRRAEELAHEIERASEDWRHKRKGPDVRDARPLRDDL